MLDTRIFACIQTLSSQKRTAFGRFLASPYFNQRNDLSILYTGICLSLKEDTAISKEKFWERSFSGRAYVESELRLLMTYLQRLFEKFIAVEELLEDNIEIKLKTAEWIRQNGLSNLHTALLKDFSKQLEKKPLRNAEYYFSKYELEWEKYQAASQSKPDAKMDFQQVIDNFDITFIGKKLRQSCLLMMHDSVYKWGFDPGFLEQIFSYLEKRKLLNIPAISIYYHCYRMLEEPEQESWFKAFKQDLFEKGSLFEKEEIQDLFLLAINYGIRKVNIGQKNYFHDIIDFYKLGLEKEYLLQDGKLRRFTYFNIVTTALQIDMTDWAETFIEEWTPKLEKRFQERMYNYNRAKIAYHKKDYDAAIPLLQRSNYHDLLMNLGARTLLLKIYHELEEYDLLQSHLDAFSSYLRRKKGLGYHRKNYRNLIRFTNRLLSLNALDRPQLLKFRTDVRKAEILTEKDWLLSRVD